MSNELFWLLLKLALNLIGVLVHLFVLVAAILAVWHGYTVDIGKPNSFHIHFQQYPLKRFFP